MGLLIRAKKITSLSIRKVAPNSGTEFTLKELQGYVGGYIEPVRLNLMAGTKIRDYEITSKTIMLVNENGIAEKLPINIVATSLTGQTIFGDVVLVESGTEFK